MEKERFFAHSMEGLACDHWQPLYEHLTATAQLASEFAVCFYSAEWGALCGLLHDLGKYSIAFQKRLNGGKRVDHSLAGAVEACRFLQASPYSALSNLLAHVISGHHTGLADGLPGRTDGPSLKERLNAQSNLPENSAWKNEISLPQAYPALPPFAPGTKEELAFSFSFWGRMLYSCLVDADFLDTEAFLQPAKAALRGEYPPLAALRDALNRFLREKFARVNAGNVNGQRAHVLTSCREAAQWDSGLFSLTVPTGGGKTLSSLAFAMDHAARHDLRRIIYVIPYTSIIEQTAEVFREAFGPELEHAVIEHHSNAEEKAAELPADADHYEDARTLAFENWDAPIIVTTAVQFFESLFAARSSRCRKLHNIAGSVIILDEAQTLPTALFRPCLAALKELIGMYRASVVLCTATQPEVGQKPWNRNGLTGVREIMSDIPTLFQALERVDVQSVGALEMPELASRLAGHDRALCIVNTRAQARDLYELLRNAPHGGKPVRHLSTWMCPAHRKTVLRHIRATLRNTGEPLLLVATSLVESGVDIDFPVVYRALAGVDSIAQAAGRCNREGRLERGQTFVFSLPGRLLGEQDRRRRATEAVLKKKLPLLSPEAVSLYFDELHSLEGEDGLDAHGILRRMWENAAQSFFPFRSVAKDFRFIEDYEVPLIIPYNTEAREALERLRAHDTDRALYRRLQQWIVGVPEAVMAKLVSSGAAETVGYAGQHYVLINEDLYHGLEGAPNHGSALGLDTREPTFREVEGLVL